MKNEENMETVIYQNGQRYSEKKYKLEAEFEKIVVDNSKIFFWRENNFC